MAVSLYHFLSSYRADPPSFNEFFEKEFLEKGFEGTTWSDHLLSWWKQKDSPSVLFIKYLILSYKCTYLFMMRCRYEDLIANLSDSIRKIAAFINVELSEELLNVVLERSSFSWMKENKQKVRLMSSRD